MLSRQGRQPVQTGACAWSSDAVMPRKGIDRDLHCARDGVALVVIPMLFRYSIDRTPEEAGVIRRQRNLRRVEHQSQIVARVSEKQGSQAHIVQGRQPLKTLQLRRMDGRGTTEEHRATLGKKRSQRREWENMLGNTALRELLPQVA